jgi:hypothetical protein
MTSKYNFRSWYEVNLKTIIKCCHQKKRTTSVVLFLVGNVYNKFHHHILDENLLKTNDLRQESSYVLIIKTFGEK